MQEERELLSRQQDAMREHAGPRELRTYLSHSYVKGKHDWFRRSSFLTKVNYQALFNMSLKVADFSIAALFH